MPDNCRENSCEDKLGNRMNQSFQVVSNLKLVTGFRPFVNPLRIDFSLKLALEDLICDERCLRLVEPVILIGYEMMRRQGD